MNETAFIPGGSFLVARSIFKSAIWTRPPQYTRLFLWLIGRAAFQEGQTVLGHTLERGQLITTYRKISDGLAYRKNKRLFRPSQKEIRSMLAWLETEGMVAVKALVSEIPNKGRHKGRPQAFTRAYQGLLISVMNYGIYQDSKSYKGRPSEFTLSAQGQLESKECIKKNVLKNPLEISEKISLLENKYPFSDQELISKTFQEIASTRKSNRIADSVRLRILESWERFSREAVLAGIQTYLAKGFAAEGKDEKYLLGIIRRQSNGQPVEPHPEGRTRKSTGSTLLDNHYRSQGFRII